MFTELADLSQQRTRDILEAAKRDPNSKIGRAYTAYLDAGAVEAKGLAPIEPWLTTVRSVDKAGLAGLPAEADRTGVSQIRREWGRGGVCQCVSISGGAVK